MEYIFTAIVFVLIFSILILIHEIGHFVMAKRAGIKVEEFGLGLPPRIWGKKKGETIYSINLIPFGGFVRMLGEDSSDEKMLINKRSFIAQPMRSRVKVIVAGVTMNFLLAYVLLTFALTLGMEPLLMPDDILPKTKENVIQIENGVVVKNVSDEAIKYGIKPGDSLVSIENKTLNIANFVSLFKEANSNFKFLSDGKEIDVSVSEKTFLQDLGFEFYAVNPYPRLKVNNLSETSIYAISGLKRNDEILKVNNEFVFSIEEFSNSIFGLSEFELRVLRDGKFLDLKVLSNEKKSVIVQSVLENSPAEKSGIVSGDLVVKINDNSFKNVSDLISLIQNSPEKMQLLIERSGEMIEVDVIKPDSQIGVVLGEMISFDNLSGLSIYFDYALNSITDIKDQKYPFYIAPIKAFEESYKLSKFTAIMFVDFVKNFVSNGDVPESVAGPVGIARMTHFFMQDGIIALLRFMALLSLSLAVINILPIPALDGGRLLFIIIELFLGRKVNQKMEAYIHFAGYLFVLMLILVVTFTDIARLF